VSDDVQPIEHNEVVEEEFHGSKKKHGKPEAVRSAHPR